MEDAMLKHRNADVLVNFASLRSAYDSTIETLNYPQVSKKLKRLLINVLFVRFLVLKYFL